MTNGYYIPTFDEGNEKHWQALSACARIDAKIDELAERYRAELWMMRCLALAHIARSAGQHRRWLKQRKSP